jgi:hypothetical protein
MNVVVWIFWESIGENRKISAKENTPLLHKGYSKLLDQRKQARLQWLQDPSQINGDKFNNITRESNRYFRGQRENI